MPDFVDIFIPTKDRPIQLHLLLDGINRHLRSIGQITISYQASDDEYKSAYQLLEKRLREDNYFENIRNNSRNIIFIERHSIEAVYDHILDSGDSNYILQLLDDEIIIRDYDLSNDPASKEFFDNQDIVTCSLRLGNNISEQNSWSKDDGVIDEIPKGHISSLISFGKPNFVIPKLGHEINHKIIEEYKSQKFLKWIWPLNLNVSHWCHVSCLTGQIYRRDFLLTLYERYGKVFFMDIEAKGLKMLKQDLFSSIRYLLPIIDFLDLIQMKLLKWIAGIYEQPVLEIIFYKITFHTRLRNKNVPHFMVSPINSVSVNMDMGSSHFRETNEDQTRDLNSLYLNGKVMCLDDIESMDFFFPWTILRERKYIDYDTN